MSLGKQQNTEIVRNIANLCIFIENL